MKIRTVAEIILCIGMTSETFLSLVQHKHVAFSSYSKQSSTAASLVQSRKKIPFDPGYNTYHMLSALFKISVLTVTCR